MTKKVKIENLKKYFDIIDYNVKCQIVIASPKFLTPKSLGFKNGITFLLSYKDNSVMRMSYTWRTQNNIIHTNHYDMDGYSASEINELCKSII